MRIDFLALTHFGEIRTRTVVEKYFEDVSARSALYAEYCEKTTAIYRKEMKADLDKQQAGFDKLMARVTKEFDEIIAAIPNPSEQDHYEAYYKVGLDQIDGEYHEEHMRLIHERYADTAEHFNRASLVTFYSLLESTLRQLCELLKNELNKRIELSHLAGKNYMETIRSYFDLVLELPLDPVESLIVKFTEVQNIRNKIVHHSGVFALDGNENIVNRIEANEHLSLVKPEGSAYCEVKVRRAQYVLDLYPEFRDLFVKLFWMVEQRMDFPVFKKNVLHLFGFVFKGVGVVIKDYKTEEYILCVIETTDEELKQVACRVTFGKPGKKSPTSVVAQFDKEYELLTRLSDHVTGSPELLIDDLFGLFVSRKSKPGVSVMLYPE